MSQIVTKKQTRKKTNSKEKVNEQEPVTEQDSVIEQETISEQETMPEVNSTLEETEVSADTTSFPQEVQTFAGTQTYINNPVAARAASALAAIDSEQRQSDAAYLGIIRDAYKRKRVLTCTISGVDVIGKEVYWSAFYGSVVIRIPFTSSYMTVEPDLLGEATFDIINRRRQLLTQALGATIRFVVTSLVAEPDGTYSALGSRTTALAMDRNFFFGPKNRFPIEKGMNVEAEVLSVGNHYFYVTICGLDVKLHLSKLSYQFIKNLNDMLSPGQKLLLRVTSVDMSNPQLPRIDLSALPIESKKIEKRLKSLTIGAVRTGKITSIKKESAGNTCVHLFLDGVGVPAFSRSVRLDLNGKYRLGSEAVFRVSGITVDDDGLPSAHGSIIKINRY